VAVDLLNGLVSYWRLDESSDGSGAVTRNDSHGSNHLTDNNTTPSGTGKINSGASCVRANSEYLEVADNAGLSPTQFSVSAWVRPVSAGMGTTRGVIVKYNSSTPAQSSFALLALVSNRLALYLRISAGTELSASPATVMSADTWYFVVGKYNGSTISLSINAGSPTTTALAGSMNDSTSALRIGMYPSNLSGSGFGGIIDEAGFWNRAIDSDEETALYNSGNGKEYPFSNRRRRVLICQ